MSTTMGACFGGCTGLLVMLIYTRLTTGHAMWDLTMSTNGALTGMVVRFNRLSVQMQTLSPFIYSIKCLFLGLNAFDARFCFGSQG